MQRKEKIHSRFSIFLFAIAVLLLGSCGRETQQYEVTVPVDREIVADGFGDNNGSASEDELKFVEEYFDSNPEAWCLGYFPTYAGMTLIPAEIVLSAFMKNYLDGPYKSEVDLREANEGVNIKTPYVGVYVLISNEKCEITQFLRAPGPHFSESEWDRIKVVSSE